MKLEPLFRPWSMLLSTGLSPLESLELLSGPKDRTVAVLARLAAGHGVAQAVSGHCRPELLPGLASGEHQGRLAEALECCADYLEVLEETRRRVWGVRFPLSVMAGMFLYLVLAQTVLADLVQYWEATCLQPPWPTGLVIFSVRLAREPGSLPLLLMGFAVGCHYWYRPMSRAAAALKTCRWLLFLMSCGLPASVIEPAVRRLASSPVESWMLACGGPKRALLGLERRLEGELEDARHRRLRWADWISAVLWPAVAGFGSWALSLPLYTGCIGNLG